MIYSLYQKDIITILLAELQHFFKKEIDTLPYLLISASFNVKEIYVYIGIIIAVCSEIMNINVTFSLHLSVRPSVLRHISGTIDYVIIIFGTHV